MQSTGEKIKKIRESMGMTQPEFAIKVCGFDERGAQQKISSYETNDARCPYDTLYLIAERIGLSVDDLIDPNVELPDKISDIHRLKRLYRAPVISWVQAGEFSPIIELSPEDIEDYVEVMSNDPNIFGLRVKGHSMEPDYKPGDIIVISPNKQPESGNLIIAKLKWEGEATFKKIILTNDYIILRPINPDYPEIKINGAERENVRIVGVVIELRRRIN